MKKNFYTIIATEVNDLKTIEKEVISNEINDYVVRGENPDSIFEPHIEVYTDEDSFARLRLSLALDPAWW